MKLHKFKDYNEYKDIQVKGYNSKHKTHSWVDTYSVKELVNYIHSYNPDAKFGLCHGTRNGKEQETFIDNFSRLQKQITVIGTEIAKHASKVYPNTIEWDFHEVKDEWLGNVDFIYSNSFDHTYDPEKCLDTWMSCLTKKGLCIIEWTKDDVGNSRPMDPFAATLEEYKKLICEKYEILDILENTPSKSNNKTFRGKRWFFIIKNK